MVIPLLVGWWLGVGQVLFEPDGDQPAGHLRESFGVDRAEQVADRAVNVIRDDMLGQQPAEPGGQFVQDPRGNDMHLRGHGAGVMVTSHSFPVTTLGGGVRS